MGMGRGKYPQDMSADIEREKTKVDQALVRAVSAADQLATFVVQHLDLGNPIAKKYLSFAEELRKKLREFDRMPDPGPFGGKSISKIGKAQRKSLALRKKRKPMWD